jgi:hypothetical protein
MRSLRIVLSVCLIAVLVSSAAAQTKGPTNKEKIIGAWEHAKTANGTAEFQWIWHFTKDGNVKVTNTLWDSGVLIETKTMAEGKYEVADDILKIKGTKFPLETRTAKITTLTNKELVIRFGSKKADEWALKKK